MMMNTDSEEEKKLPTEINLVHFDVPELIVNKIVPTASKNSNDTGCYEEIFEGLNAKFVLNRILPLREWTTDDDKHWRQKISNKPVSKMESKELGEKLDTYLKTYEAKVVGICPIKRELYSQCFNEIIRQVTLECAQQGYILIEIRNEINTTINSHQNIFEITMARGLLKKLQAENKKINLEKETDILKEDNETLETKLAELKEKTFNMEREMAAAHNAEIKIHDEKMDVLKKSRRSFKAQLESLIRDDPEDLPED